MNFNYETIGKKNSSAHELLSKKYATIFTIHGQIQTFAISVINTSLKSILELKVKIIDANLSSNNFLWRPSFFRRRSPLFLNAFFGDKGSSIIASRFL